MGNLIKNTWLFPIEVENISINVGDDIDVLSAIGEMSKFLKINKKNSYLEFSKHFNLPEEQAKLVTKKIIDSTVSFYLKCLEELDVSESEIIIKALEKRIINELPKKIKDLIMNNYLHSQYFKKYDNVKLNPNSDREKKISQICWDLESSVINYYEKMNVNDLSTIVLKKLCEQEKGFKNIKVPEIKDWVTLLEENNIYKTNILKNFMFLQELEKIVLTSSDYDKRVEDIKNLCVPAFNELWVAFKNQDETLNNYNMEETSLDISILISDIEINERVNIIKTMVKSIFDTDQYFTGSQLAVNLLTTCYIGEYTFFKDLVPKNIYGNCFKSFQDDDKYIFEMNLHKLLMLDMLKQKRILKDGKATTLLDVIGVEKFNTPIHVPFILEYEKTESSKLNEKYLWKNLYKSGIEEAFVKEIDCLLKSCKKNGFFVEAQRGTNSIQFISKNKSDIDIVKRAIHLCIQEDVFLGFENGNSDVFKRFIEDILTEGLMKKDIQKSSGNKKIIKF